MQVRRLWKTEATQRPTRKRDSKEMSLKEDMTSLDLQNHRIGGLKTVTEMLRPTTNLTALQRIQIGKKTYYIQVTTSFPSGTIT